MVEDALIDPRINLLVFLVYEIEGEAVVLFGTPPPYLNILLLEPVSLTQYLQEDPFHDGLRLTRQLDSDDSVTQPDDPSDILDLLCVFYIYGWYLLLRSS